MAWLYVPGLVVLNSDSSLQSQVTKPYVTLSGKPSQRPLSWRGWKTRSWIKLLSGTISHHLMAHHGVESWISSLRDFRVSPGVLRESEKEQKTSDGFGPTLNEYFAKWDHNTSSWKTCQDSFVEELNTFSDRWPQWGSMRNGECFQRSNAVPHMSGNGCSFWPSPNVHSLDNYPGASKTSGWGLQAKTRMWATPQAFDATDCIRDHKSLMRAKKKGGCKNLREDVKNWATPTQRDYKGQDIPNRTGSPSLGHQVLTQKNGLVQKSEILKLNPQFVEWLMNLPRSWTNPICSLEPTGFEHWVTQWSQLLRRMLSQHYLRD